MKHPPQHQPIAAHITSVRTRSSVHTTALTAALVRRSWPGGVADRSEPTALPWVKRWGSGQLIPVTRACSCAEGRCLVCN
jgi:hypothetical protein